MTLPPALVGGPSTPDICKALGIATGTSCDTPDNEAKAAKLENGLPDVYLKCLLTGGTGQTSKTPDKRISYDGREASHLPPGPFQITSPRSSRRLRRQPCPSFLPDVSGTRLQRRRRAQLKTLRAAPPISSSGLDFGRRGFQRRGSASEFHRRNDGRGLVRDGVLQRPWGRRALSDIPGRNARGASKSERAPGSIADGADPWPRPEEPVVGPRPNGPTPL